MSLGRWQPDIVCRRPRGVGINCLVALQREAWRNEYLAR